MRTTVLHRGELSVLDHRCDAEPGATPFDQVPCSHALSYLRTATFGDQVAGRQLVPG